MNRRQQRQRRGEGGHVRPWEFSISVPCRCPFPFSVPSVASCLIPSPLPNANGPPPGNIPLRRALLDTGPRWPSGSSDTTSRLLPVYHMRRLISRGKLSSFVHMAVKTTQHRQPACLAHSPRSLTHLQGGTSKPLPWWAVGRYARLLPAGAVESHGGAACDGPPSTHATLSHPTASLGDLRSLPRRDRETRAERARVSAPWSRPAAAGRRCRRGRRGSGPGSRGSCRRCP